MIKLNDYAMFTYMGSEWKKENTQGTGGVLRVISLDFDDLINVINW